jgi:hypothetical protein
VRGLPVVEVIGTLDEIEAEMRLVLNLRSREILDGRLNGKNWLMALAEEVDEILRRRQTAQQRHVSR